MKTKLFCETSSRNEISKLINKVFSARVPLKMESASSETKLFWRDFLQKLNLQTQKQSFFARLPSNDFASSKNKIGETSFRNDNRNAIFTSEVQDVSKGFFLGIWMPQKHCACHETAQLKHTAMRNDLFVEAKFSSLWAISTCQNCLVSSISAVTSLCLSHLRCTNIWRLYSCKLGSLNFLR